MSDIPVNPHLTIPPAELAFRFSRSGGPGGQHVNTSSTRVELIWDVVNSPTLSDTQRARVLAHLAGRIDGEGVLHLTVEETRSQLENRERAEARLGELVAAALRPRKTRRPTKPSAAAKERRLAAKRRRAEVKRGRRGEE